MGIYSQLNTFIQFIAAIFVTIALDDVLFNRFWTPNIYKQTLSILREYKLKNTSDLDINFKNVLKERFKGLESLTRKRGFFSVCVCLFLLVYNVLLSIESYSSQYPFIIYVVSLVLAYFFLLISRWIFCRRWIFSISLVVYIIIISLLIKYINTDVMTDSAVDRIEDSGKVVIIVILLVGPIIYQLILSWLYSKGYTHYLRSHISKEAEKYRRAKDALSREDDSLIPEEYRECFATAVREGTQDLQMTNIEQHLYTKLESICCDFSLWNIIVKIDFKNINDQSFSEVKKLDDEDESVESIENEIDYGQMVSRYESIKNRPSISNFCRENQLNEEEFRKIRRNRNQVKSK